MRFCLVHVACCLAVVLVASVTGPAVAQTDQPMIGEEAPGFTLPTTADGTLSLADLRGKYVVIHFGTSW